MKKEKLIVFTHKRFWLNSNGEYVTNGGFLSQIEAIANVYDETLIICQKINNSNKAGVFVKNNTIKLEPISYYNFRNCSRKINAVLNFPILFIHSLKYIKQYDDIHVILPGEGGFVGLIISLFFKKNTIVRFCTSPKKEIFKMDMPFIKSTLWLFEKLNGKKNYSIFMTGLFDKGVSEKWKSFKWIFSTTLKTEEIPAFQIKNNDQLNLLFIGRLDDNKNIFFSIEVFLEALKKIPEATYTIIGSGPLFDEINENYKDLINQNKLILKGYLKIEEMAEIKGNSNLFLFPSKVEGSPKVIPEVFAFGIPVVCSNAGNLDWLVGKERGIVLSLFDKKLYSESVLQIWENKQKYNEMSTNAYEFSKNIVLENWVKTLFNK